MDADWEEAMDVAAWEPEQLLIDRYRVKECVRQSGTCQLYRVEDVFRDKFHLVLRPSPRLSAREGWREWFAEYCQRALSVPAHPNVLVCERTAEEGDVPFLIMEDAQGRGWDSLIFDGSLMELPLMLDVALQVAQGLAWLHSHGHIHYNVKPANVLVCDSGLVKVWKYGESDARTRAFASPEQLAGGSPLTNATDVWSWAVSVLHMFVGRVVWPSGAEAPLVLRRYMQNGPARGGIPLMPGALARVLAKCLKSGPGERVVTMEGIVEALEGIRQHAMTAPQPAGPVGAEVASPPADAARAEEAGFATAGSAPTVAAAGPPEPGPPASVPPPPERRQGGVERFWQDREEEKPGGPRRFHRPE